MTDRRCWEAIPTLQANQVEPTARFIAYWLGDLLQ